MADYALKYNNVLLQSAVAGAQVTELDIQPIPILFTKYDRVAGDGNPIVRSRLNQRNVKIGVELPFSPDVASFTSKIRLLRLWAEPDNQEHAMEFPDYPGKYLNCALTDIGDYNIDEWYKPIMMTFTAFDEPCFFSSAESTGSVGSAFSVTGDKPAQPIITHTISSTLTNPQWTLATGYVISLSGTYSSGVIVIDTKRGYVTRNGESLMQYLNPASRFYKFPKGSHVITGPSGGVITWRERWRD